jgi:putative addiction module killer protein
MREAQGFQLLYYLSANGKSPFLDWMRSLSDPVAYRAIQRRLFRLEDGNLGDCKTLESLLELRIDHGPGYRIYCGKEGGAYIVLLVGGTKKGQQQDIDKAKRYWADYRSARRPPFGSLDTGGLTQG